MDRTDLCYTPATDLARAIRDRRLSPLEVVDAFLARIEALEPRLNAFATLTADAAREAARRAEDAVVRGEPLGPLHGVPVGIKDFIETAGVRTAFGSRVLEHNVPQHDNVVVTRLRDAGAIVLGKTTGPDFGWKALGDSPLTGITRNPWNLERTPGGSSAGAAAQVAAGLGPLAVGSDGAGSIRIPASFCGIFGLKPSFGRVPMPGTPVHLLAHNGPLTRTVPDCALLMNVIAGPHPTDPHTLEGPPDDYAGRLHDGVRGWRVAWSPDLGGCRVEPEVREVCAGAARAFEELGCSVEEVVPPWEEPKDILDELWMLGYAGRLAPYLDEWAERMDPGLVAMVREGLTRSPTTFVQSQIRRYQWWQQVWPFFDRYDLLLTPAVSVPALPAGALNPPDWPQHPWDWLQWAPFSYPFNMTGQPAASVPAGFTADGLPVGLQIVGGRFADLAVLQAAAAYEQARPWTQHRPPL